MSIQSINPATGEPIATYAELSHAEMANAVAAAHEAWGRWRRTTFAERGRLMRAHAALLRGRRGELARLMALEMGKPVAQGAAEIDKCAWVCEYYAEHAEAHLAADVISTDAARSYVVFDPLGVVLAVMPWNFPFWQVYRFAAPALMAGNVGILKHASNVPGCALAIEKMLAESGFPAGVFRTALVGSAHVKALIADPRVRAVTLTGSTPAGQSVAAAAGAALKKTVLELGGADAYLILDDADLDLAAETCAASRLINAGQSCIAAKRFVVVESVREAFTAKFVERMAARRVGDPLADGTTIGPLARRDLRDSLHDQVTRSIALGASVRLGAERPSGTGAFYPPTVLTDVKPGMPAYDEELFGPVAAVISARDEADAVRIANDSVFGLGAAIFTRDIARAERIARDIEAGSTFINSFVASDPRLPFGGVKASGYGRELGSYGIREFVNIKTVSIAAANAVAAPTE